MDENEKDIQIMRGVESRISIWRKKMGHIDDGNVTFVQLIHNEDSVFVDVLVNFPRMRFRAKELRVLGQEIIDFVDHKYPMMEDDNGRYSS